MSANIFRTERFIFRVSSRLEILFLVIYQFLVYPLQGQEVFSIKAQRIRRDSEKYLSVFFLVLSSSLGGFLFINPGNIPLFFNVPFEARKLSAHNYLGFPLQFPLG